MAYTRVFSLRAPGALLANLRAQLYDSSGNAVGSALSSGFSGGSGGYFQLAASIPDGHAGVIQVYDVGAPTVILGSEAINADSGGPAGARTVQLTITDGSVPLEGARVRLTKGSQSYLLISGADGVVTFGVDDGTWNRVITCEGFSYSPDTLGVSANVTATCVMTAVTIPVPADPAQSTVYGAVYDASGTPVAGAELVFEATTIPGTLGAKVLAGTSVSVTSAADGSFQVTLWRDVTYSVRCGAAPKQSIIPNAATFAIPPMIGR